MRIIVKVPDDSTCDELTLFMNCAAKSVHSALQDDKAEKSKGWYLLKTYSVEFGALSGDVYANTQRTKTGYRVIAGWEKEAIA